MCHLSTSCGSQLPRLAGFSWREVKRLSCLIHERDWSTDTLGQIFLSHVQQEKTTHWNFTAMGHHIFSLAMLKWCENSWLMVCPLNLRKLVSCACRSKITSSTVEMMVHSVVKFTLWEHRWPQWELSRMSFGSVERSVSGQVGSSSKLRWSQQEPNS